MLNAEIYYGWRNYATEGEILVAEGAESNWNYVAEACRQAGMNLIGRC